MKISYYADTDSLYIEFLATPGTNVTVVSDDIRLDTDNSGRAVGIDIDNESKYYDVTNLEAVGLQSIHMIAPQTEARI